MTARRVKQWRSALFLYGGLAAHLTGVVAFYTRIAAHIGTSDGWFMVGAIGAAGMLIACVETLYRENGTIRRNRRELQFTAYCALCASLVVAQIALALANLPEAVKTSLGAVVCNAFALHLANLTQAEVDVVERCRAAVAKHPDHSSNLHGRAMFDAVLLWTVRFLQNRSEVTQNDDPTVAYLFEREDGSLPHEDELQADYFRWLTTNAAGTDLEPTNVGGGRADIRIKSSGERLVIEVKREMVDASFSALAAAYAAQSSDYQNVSVRIGFMLVLDLVQRKIDGTPHLTTLFETHEIPRSGEDIPRLIAIVKIPGRRMRPSDLSRIAKARSRKST